VRVIREYQVDVGDAILVVTDLDEIERLTGEEGLYAGLLDTFTRYVDVGEEAPLNLYRVENEQKAYLWSSEGEAYEDWVKVYGPVNADITEVGVEFRE
jgi:hypothetical protein